MVNIIQLVSKFSFYVPVKTIEKILQPNLKWYFNGICKTIQREIKKIIMIVLQIPLKYHFRFSYNFFSIIWTETSQENLEINWIIFTIFLHYFAQEQCTLHPVSCTRCIRYKSVNMEHTIADNYTNNVMGASMIAAQP